MLDFGVLKRDLTRHLGRIRGDVVLEVDRAVKEAFPGGVGGAEDGFQQVRLHRALTTITERVATRVFVGETLSSSKPYLRALRLWLSFFGLSAVFLQLATPKFLVPVVAPIVAVPVTLARWWVCSWVVGVLKRRRASGVKEMDVLQWIADAAVGKEDALERSEWYIAERVLLFNAFGEYSRGRFTSVDFSSSRRERLQEKHR